MLEGNKLSVYPFARGARRKESKSFRHRVFTATVVVVIQKPARTAFSYLICRANKKQTGGKKLF